MLVQDLRRGLAAALRSFLLPAAALLLVAGCATSPGEGDDLGYGADEISDPLEPLNRQIFAINQAADTLVVKPVAVVYRKVVPDPIQANVHSFLDWISLPLVFIHDMLQGEWERAGQTAERFVINMQVFGLGDLAAGLGKPANHSEDAGQTFAVWGVRDGGPYLVLPLLGPSNLRDAVGFCVDALIDPTGMALGTTGSIARAGTAGVDFRARNMEAIDDLQRTSVDYYAAVRSLYRQRRASEIRNGGPDGVPPGPGLAEGVTRPLPKDAQGAN